MLGIVTLSVGGSARTIASVGNLLDWTDLRFDDNVTLRILLNDANSVGPEAAEYINGDIWIVW